MARRAPVTTDNRGRAAANDGTEGGGRGGAEGGSARERGLGYGGNFSKCALRQGAWGGNMVRVRIF
jgi:hypothetical protein